VPPRGRVDRHGEQLHGRADAVLLAKIEGMTGRVGQRDPGRAGGQPGGAQADGALGRGFPPFHEQVEVELLRVLLSGPLRQSIIRSRLETDLLAVTGPHIDPAAVDAEAVAAVAREDMEVGVEHLLKCGLTISEE